MCINILDHTVFLWSATFATASRNCNAMDWDLDLNHHQQLSLSVVNTGVASPIHTVT